jgi:NAD(P)-dependent dehydrogenase (short-subunit alcohol dehydrogenase family)
MDLTGKTAFVTGATRGIGLAIAAQLQRDGARVVGCGRSQPPADAALADFIAADFTRPEAIEQCAQQVTRLAPDILVNNAGINKIAPFAAVSFEDFTRIQMVNVCAPFALCRAAVSGMQARGWGRIVNISSIWGKISREQRAAYSASKFALDGMTLALALEYARFGVLANCIAPGFTDTELTRRILGEQQIRELEQTVPARRMASVAEIAAFVAWLVSPANSYITGQNIAIDGGYSRG